MSYINIKVHYSDNFNLKCISLKTEHFPHPHTGRAVGEKLAETITFFELQNKNFKVISDGGSNIVAAMKIKNIQRFNCMAHSLHRFISHDILNNDLFANLNNIIQKLKQIFRALSYRGDKILEIQKLKENEKIYDILLTIQDITKCIDSDENISFGNIEEKLEAALKSSHLPSIKNSVETRWNSIAKMIKSFTANFDVVNIILLKIKKEYLLIPSMEEELLKEFAEFLEIFEEATIYMQGQKYATVSCAIYFFENIYTKLSEKGQQSSFGLMIHLYDFAKQNFFKRFKILKLHLVAALLDPCQKNWSSLTKYLKRVPENRIIPDDFILETDFENHPTKEKLLYEEIINRGISEDCSSDEPQVK